MLSAQDSILVSKRGVPILPQKGDLSIGIDAVPFFNLFKDNGTSPGFNFAGDTPSLTLKYMTKDNRAIRMAIDLGYFLITDDMEPRVGDRQVNNSLGLGFGYEWRRGSSRIQGIYGMQGNFKIGRTKIEYEDADRNVDRFLYKIGIAGFIGVECFIAPKLSLRGQFLWGPELYKVNDKIDDTSRTSFDVGLSSANGAIILGFYF